MTRLEEARPLVLVTVGTDFHPFDRLITWTEEWIERSGADVRCLVQYGRSTPPRRAEGRPFFDHAELQAAMTDAAVVVAHGGPGTLTEARSHGHHPICVPRDPSLGEHVDDHQQRFARHLAAGGLLMLAETRTDLETALHAALEAAGERSAQITAPARRTSPTQLESIRRVAELVSPLITPASSQEHLKRQ